MGLHVEIYLFRTAEGLRSEVCKACGKKRLTVDPSWNTPFPDGRRKWATALLCMPRDADFQCDDCGTMGGTLFRNVYAYGDSSHRPGSAGTC